MAPESSPLDVDVFLFIIRIDGASRFPGATRRRLHSLASFVVRPRRDIIPSVLGSLRYF